MKDDPSILGVISPAQANRFLLSLANHNILTPAGRNRLVEEHREVWPWMMQVFDSKPQVVDDLLTVLQSQIRKVWDAPDRREREWYSTLLRYTYHHYHKRITGSNTGTWDDLQQPPPVTPFEAATFYLSAGIADRARHCTGPNCAAPYFIAEKRSQKYCFSPECALQAQREAKRKWWHEHRGKGL